ncbi:hypothetical protein RB195_021763 [Necator americanus]|uniref:Uncharacterized protein n=1 Tax=Necator americanus TaxID=51031 RepID=A0ABR1ECJ1_NECAM
MGSSTSPTVQPEPCPERLPPPPIVSASPGTEALIVTTSKMAFGLSSPPSRRSSTPKESVILRRWHKVVDFDGDYFIE